MPTRVGDTWTFKVNRTVLVRDQVVVANLGSVVAGEEYHAFLTGRVTWEDPVGDPVDRMVGLQLSLAAFDANNGQITSWDNDLIVSQDHSYRTAGTSHRHDIPVLAQAVIEPPVNCETLKLEMSYSTGDDAGQIVVEEATVILSVVTTPAV